MINWDGNTFDADGLTGERLSLRDAQGFTVGTVIVWPGRKTRIFWAGGDTQDFAGPDSRGAAVRAVEARAFEDLDPLCSPAEEKLARQLHGDEWHRFI